MSKQPLSANQNWKQSGTTLSFAEYMNREKAKANSLSADGMSENEMMINKPLNQAVQDSLASARADAGFRKKVSGNTILGINKYLVIGSVMVIAGAIAYNIYKKNKK